MSERATDRFVAAMAIALGVALVWFGLFEVWPVAPWASVWPVVLGLWAMAAGGYAMWATTDRALRRQAMRRLRRTAPVAARWPL